MVKGGYSTRVVQARSGKEQRAVNRTTQIRSWAITYDWLVLADRMTLTSFFDQMQGQFGTFTFITPERTSQTDYAVGTGNSATTTYDLPYFSDTATVTTGNTSNTSTAVNNIPILPIAGQTVTSSGTGIPANNYVVSVTGTGPYAIALAVAATATNTALPLTFGPIFKVSGTILASTWTLGGGALGQDRVVFTGAPALFAPITSTFNSARQTFNVRFAEDSYTVVPQFRGSEDRWNITFKLIEVI